MKLLKLYKKHFIIDIYYIVGVFYETNIYNKK